MLDIIRDKILGEQYKIMEEIIKSLKRTNKCLLSLLEEIKAERNELKMELAEAYTYMAELKEKAEGKGD